MKIKNSFSCIIILAAHHHIHMPRRCDTHIMMTNKQDIPIVIAGNKLDLANTHREVSKEDVSEWVYCELPRLK